MKPIRITPEMLEVFEAITNLQKEKEETKMEDLMDYLDVDYYVMHERLKRYRMKGVIEMDEDGNWFLTDWALKWIHLLSENE